MKKYIVTVGRAVRPHCEFCRRHLLVIRWSSKTDDAWACVWHTRRAWKALEKYRKLWEGEQ